MGEEQELREQKWNRTWWGGGGKKLHGAGEESAGEIVGSKLEEEGGSRAGLASAFNTLPSALVKPTSLLSSLYPLFQASFPLAPPPLLQL